MFQCQCLLGEEEEFITNNSYLAQNADELGFERGVIVLVLQKNYDGWWTCRYQGKEGLIPAAYLEPNTQDISKSGHMSLVMIVLCSYGSPELSEIMHPNYSQF